MLNNVTEHYLYVDIEVN